MAQLDPSQRRVSGEPMTCLECEDHVWILFDQGNNVLAQPCPICKPREYDAYQRGQLNHAYFAERDGRAKLSPEEARERNKQRAKEKFDL